VLLRWTTPSMTTDGLAVKGAMTAQICREVGQRSGGAAPRGPCAPILRLAVAPGPSQVSDILQGGLRSDPVMLLVYRVQILNSAERTAGDSGPALAAAGSAPAPVEDLKATPGEHGAVLEWDAVSGKRSGVVELKRVDLSAPPSTEKAAKPLGNPVARPGGRNKPAGAKASGEHPDEVRLRSPETANAGNQSNAGTVDATAKTGDTYTYIAQRVRSVSVGGHDLEIRSEPSGSVTLAFRDIFPPARPTGLATIPGFAPATGQMDGQHPTATVLYIDLSWEANNETDLSGYLVYRQVANADGLPQGSILKLTPSPIAVPAYRDVAVNPGQRYIYQVTAVDASGNESAPSAKAQDVVPSGLNSPN
jgi:hypothetical protein